MNRLGCIETRTKRCFAAAKGCEEHDKPGILSCAGATLIIAGRNGAPHCSWGPGMAHAQAIKNNEEGRAHAIE